MFELSVARKYLTPRWRQLSVSIISLISILVIALVVWLIVVFFSVTNGLEKGWVQKLIALTAPIRMTPTQAYYDSHYYLVDSISSASDYTTKTIGEKLRAENSDPYDTQSDEEPPLSWPAPVKNEDGSLRDIVKETFQLINTLPGFSGMQASDFEVTMSNLRLRLLRSTYTGKQPQRTQAFISQSAYLGSVDTSNPLLKQTFLGLTGADVSNTLDMLAIGPEHIQEETPAHFGVSTQTKMREKLQLFAEATRVEQLKTPAKGWVLPKDLYPLNAQFRVLLVYAQDELKSIIIPRSLKSLATLEKSGQAEGLNLKSAKLEFINGTPQVDGHAFHSKTPLLVEGDTFLDATLLKESIPSTLQPRDIRFNGSIVLQGVTLTGSFPLADLSVARASKRKLALESPLFWVAEATDGTFTLPTDSGFGEPILLPKTFRDTGGVLVGDRGYLSYFAPTASSVQEQRLPVFVAGFYDPGIIPLGGKFILSTSSVTSLIRSSHQQDESGISNGINIRFDQLNQTDQIKAALLVRLRQADLAKYWKVETYKEFEFTRDLLQQLESDKLLFTLISAIIILVACSNIISMLIILVNDKKVEIGILRSMGASSTSIAVIFGTCGIVMGLIGSLIGTVAAVITLKNLDILILFLSKLQGHNAFNPMFYGENLPNEISIEALLFVMIATGLISLIAGVVPAIKASMLRPSAILRSE